MFHPQAQVPRGNAGGAAVQRLCRYAHNFTKQKAQVLQNRNLKNETK